MKKLAIILLALIILGFGGYLAYDKITDFVVKKTLNMVMEDEKLKAEVDAVLEGVELAPEIVPAPENSPTGQEAEPSPMPKAPVDEKGRPANIFPTAPPKTPAPSKKDGTLTMDDLKGADKTYVMGIYKRFSASEVSTVSGMLSGGLTAEEKKAIKAIVYAKVSRSEIDKLFQIAKKYQ